MRLWLSLGRMPADPHQPPFDRVALVNLYQNPDLFKGSGTGFFVKPDLVVTAAHNLLTATWDSIGVYRAVDARKNPVGSISASGCAWDQSRDCAVLVLERGAGAAQGFDLAAAASVKLAGYAYPYGDGSPCLTYGQGPCTVHGEIAQYEILARQGDSGGPVTGGSAARLVAMHTDSAIGRSGQVGLGQLIDDGFIELVRDLERKARQ